MILKVGDIVCAQVIGIQPYGAFMQVNKEYSGLLHISEISHNYVKDINTHVGVGDKLEVKIVDINHEKKQVILSIKALKKYGRKVNNLKKKIYREKINDQEIGFTSLKNHLDFWIEQYYRRNNND